MADKKKTKRNPMDGLVHMGKPTDKDGNVITSEKAPFAKGFIGLSKKVLQILLEQEEDDYGSIKLDIAVWKKADQPGVLTGTVQLPYRIRKELEEKGELEPKRGVNPKVKSYEPEEEEAF